MCYNNTKRELECICYTLIILLQFMVLTDRGFHDPCTNVSENVMKDGILHGSIEIMEWTAHRNKPLPKKLLVFVPVILSRIFYLLFRRTFYEFGIACRANSNSVTSFLFVLFRIIPLTVMPQYTNGNFEL